MSDPEGYLMVGIGAMLRKGYSPKNLAKSDWLSMTDEQVVALLEGEMRELESAVATGDSHLILMEAVDVLAFASMLADPARGDPDAPRPRRLYDDILDHAIARGMVH